MTKKKVVTTADQLKNTANFVGKEGGLYLVRCMACGDGPRGRENWAPAVASGTCAWCGWKEDNAKLV